MNDKPKKQTAKEKAEEKRMVKLNKIATAKRVISTTLRSIRLQAMYAMTYVDENGLTNLQEKSNGIRKLARRLDVAISVLVDLQ